MTRAVESAGAEWLEVASQRSTRQAESVLDRPAHVSRGAMPLAAFGTVSVHAVLVVLATYAGARSVNVKSPAVAVTEMVEVDLRPPPQPPPPEPVQEVEPPPPEPAEPEPRPAPRPRPRAPDATREAPPPAAAEAGAALTAEEFVDFGETLVVGTGERHAGGVTEAGGTSKRTVRDSHARAGGVQGGTGSSVQGDLSRPPQLAGGAEWDCPFPEEADEEGVDAGLVSLRIEVSPEGKVLHVDVLSDPGHGFGREARRCASHKRWAAGLDRAGRPTQSVALVNVRFQPQGR